MKLKKGVTVYSGGRTFKGECPDDLLPSAQAEPVMVGNRQNTDGKKSTKK